MKPSIPWSVKGIEGEARVAAKEAARRAGMTLGQWLNSVILENAEEARSSERKEATEPAASAAPVKPAKARSGRSAPEAPAASASARTAGGESAKPAEQRERAAPTAPQPKKKAAKVRPGQSAQDAKPKGASDDIARRLDRLAEQLSVLTRTTQDTAVDKFIKPNGTEADERMSMQSILDRIQAHEDRTATAFEQVHERLDGIGSRLDETGSSFPGRAEDVPGYTALEDALRNIVGHIEVSEERTADALKAMQERMGQLAEHVTQAEGAQGGESAPSLEALEGRISELADRVEASGSEAPEALRSYVDDQVSQLAERIDAVNQTTQTMADRAKEAALQIAQRQSQDVEERLRLVASEAASAVAAAEKSGSGLTSLREEIDALNQRLDSGGGASAASEDVKGLSEALERLNEEAARRSDLVPLEERLADLNRRLDESAQKGGLTAQVEDLERRVYALDDQLRQAIEQRQGDESLGGLEQQIASLGERLGATEEKLGHLATIEQSVAQLFDSVEQSRMQTEQAVERVAAEEGGETGVASSAREIQALQEGLAAVQASTESADQRTQETLEAVHDTLEQIIAKLTELEMRNDGEPPSGPLAPPPDIFGDGGPKAAEQPVVADTNSDAEAESEDDAADPEISDGDEKHARSAEEASDQAPDAVAEGPVLTAPAAGEPTVEAPVEDDPRAENPVREDFIAAARRAAQSANAPADKGMFASFGLAAKRDREPQAEAQEEAPARTRSRFSLPFLSRAGKNESAGDEPAETAEAGADAGDGGSRKRLILAGLILLAAASAYALGGAVHVNAPEGSKDGTDGDTRIGLSDVAVAPALAAVPARVAAAGGGVGPDAAAAKAQRSDGGEATRKGALQLTAVQRTATLPVKIGSQALREAALRGDAHAQFIVASRYLDGKMVERRLDKAAEWYQRAAGQGLAPAQYRLATLFEGGRGVSKDLMIARMWYERAAKRGNVKAMHNLAVLFASSRDKTGDFAKAARWFRTAAEHGLKDSLYNLAILYERGLGVDRDFPEAHFWFAVAARHGDTGAAQKVAALKANLKKDVLAQSNRRVSEWKPKRPDREANFVSVSDPAWEVNPAGQKTQGLQAAKPGAEVELEGKDLVLRAQELLEMLGYDVGSKDGVMGSRTANAVRLFQLQTGLQVNGSVTPDLVRQLESRTHTS